MVVKTIAEPSMTEVTSHIANGVATIALNRPEVLNAFTPTMGVALAEAMAAAHKSPDVRVIVLTGAGRGFCAGADFKVLGEIQAKGGYAGQGSPQDNMPKGPSSADFKTPRGPDVSGHYGGRFGYFMSIDKPIIAAINGPAAGLGFVLMLYADMRIAAQGAKMTTSFSERGLIAEHGLSWLLPRLIGPSQSLDLLFSSRRLDAAEAKGLGLVNQVIPDATFMADVTRYAEELASRVSPRSLAVMKRQIWKALFQSFDEALDVANAEMAKSFTSPDFKEGVAHWLEKRPARFPKLS
jgi:enoyl-CoA hydratase/carnithine racemase